MSRKTTRTQAIDRHIGQHIRFYRIQRQLSQEDLAARLGISYQQLHKYETGENSATAGRLADIASALEIAVDDLFEGYENEQAVASWVHHFSSREQLLLAKYFNQIRHAEERQAICALVSGLSGERRAATRVGSPPVHDQQATA